MSTLIKLPAGNVSLRLEASGAISDATLGDEPTIEDAEPAADPGRPGNATFAVRSQGEPLYLTFAVQTGQAGRTLVDQGRV